MKRFLSAIVLLLLYNGVYSQTLLKDIYTGAGSSRPASITPFGNIALFVAQDSLHGYELWKTDGTEQGTVMVKDIYPGPNSSVWADDDGDDQYSLITVMGDQAYFYAADDSLDFELWKTDGTEQGTVRVLDINPGINGSSEWPTNFLLLNAAGNELYFAADNGTDGSQLWKSDGTPGGTTMVKKVTTSSGSAFVNVAFADSNLIYFTASNDTSGIEPFVTDGTTQGTILLKDIDVGGQSSDAGWFAKFKDEVFFSAYDGHNQKLFYTDGTTQGTVEIFGADTNSVYFDPEGLVVYNDRLLFSAADYTHGWELWNSDGTDSGTYMIKDIWPGVGNGYPFYLTPFNGQVFFIADDSIHSQELWRTDGTAAGTNMVKDIYPINQYDQGARIDNMYVVGQTLYFSATDSVHGQEPWITDGTTNGTRMLADICPGVCDANPADFVQSQSANGPQLYFAAEEPEYGREIYHIDLPTGIGQVEIPVGFRLQPNPANNLVMIVTSSEAVGYNLQVLDITGREVSSSVLTSVNYQLNISNMPAGLYFVKLTSKEGKVGVQKMVVE